MKNKEKMEVEEKGEGEKVKIEGKMEGKRQKQRQKNWKNGRKKLEQRHKLNGKIDFFFARKMEKIDVIVRSGKCVYFLTNYFITFHF